MPKYIKTLLVVIICLSLLLLTSCEGISNHEYSIYQVNINKNSKENNENQALIQTYLESFEENAALLENVPNLANMAVNVTPKDLDRKCSIYRFPISGCGRYNAETFLIYNNKVHHLGSAFGGYGVTEFAYCKAESRLYFIYSFGSGIHRSCLAYFDFKEEVVITSLLGHVNEQVDSFTMEDVSFKVFDDTNTLGLVFATIKPSEDWFSFTITKKETYKEDISILFPKEK